MGGRDPGERLQTIDRPTQTPRPRPRWVVPAFVALGVATIPVLLLAIFTKWGVLLLVVLAIAVALLLAVWQQGILFIEVVAFLIHFDGIGAGQIRMGRFVAGFAALLMLYKLVVQRWRPPALPLRVWAPIWGLLVWATVSGLWAAESGTWISNMLIFLLGVVYFAIASMLVDSHDKVHKFLRAYWIGGMFGSTVGMLGLLVGGRAAGFNDDANFFGLLEASMIPLTVYYRRHAATSQAKALYTVAFLVVLGGAAGAGSRSGLIGATIAIVATMVTRPGLTPGRRSRVAIAAVVVGAMAFVGGFVANPSNLERGFADRGAGRLDFLTVAIPLIKQQPITGYGFGQLRLLIPPQLRVTPGSQQLNETREDVSSHNTYLDTVGDLGLIGLSLFLSVLLVTAIGLIRPRWLQMKEISMTAFVMFLPVLSSSLFLPLLNNKLAWALIGLSASMQVPSWRSRWRGLAGTPPTDMAELTAGPVENSALARNGAARGSLAVATQQSAQEAPVEGRLARWDLRLGRRSKQAILASVLAGAILAGAVGSTLPTHYSATAAIISRRFDTSVEAQYTRIDLVRLQGVLTLAVSGAYAIELQRLSGIDLTPWQVRERMSVTRPKTGNLLQIVYRDTSRANTVAVMPFLVTALDNVFTDSRGAAQPAAENEARPSVPGEQRIYTGPYYIRAYSDAVFGQDPPPTTWMVFVGMLSGGLAALGWVLAGARRARIESSDDFPRFTGLRVWTHVGSGRSRRLRATGPQFEQLVAAAVDSAATAAVPSRIVVTSPTSSSESARLATGVAAALVAEGRRVVLVDAQLDRPRLSRRLSRGGAVGIADLDRHGVTVSDVLRPVRPRRLPVVPRRLLGEQSGNLRFIAAGSRQARARKVLCTEWLEQLDPGVTVVVLAPPTIGEVPVNALLAWSDATVLSLIDGRTTTVQAEESAATVRLFAHGAQGIVLVNG